MILTINGTVAAIKKGSTFEYVAENRDFTEADGYTLEIELPLKDCQQNLAIFGHINRHDAPLNTNTFNATLQDVNLMKQGTVIITEITEVAVKVQFLEGKSQQNNDIELSKIYINELELGTNTYIAPDEGYNPEEWNHNKSSWPAENCLKDITDGQEFQALPWINNYSGNTQNAIDYSGTKPVWKDNYGALSWQIYLRSLTERIFKAIGFSYELEPWNHGRDEYLLMCNTVPGAWESKNIADALPHWTIEEYLEQLEMLLQCEFNINYATKRITMVSQFDERQNAGTYTIDNVVNQFSSKTESNAGLTNSRLVTYKYASQDNDMWKWQDCQWLIDKAINEGKVTTYSTMSAMFDAIPQYELVTYSGTYGIPEPSADLVHSDWEKRVIYVSERKTYFGVKKIFQEYITKEENNSTSSPGQYYTRYKYYVGLRIIPLNAFTPYTTSSEAEEKELKIVPAWIDDVATSKISQALNPMYLFLDCGELDEEPSNIIQDMLNNGENEGQKQEIFDKIYVAYWDARMVDVETKLLGCLVPETQVVNVTLDQKEFRGMYNGLILKDRYSSQRKDFDIEVGYTYEFQWLGKEIPNPRAIFYIHGKRYLCEKITATFGENGMSELLKGTFYRLKN